MNKSKTSFSFYEKLKEARISAGYTQQSVADQIGELRTNYLNMEKGRRPPSDKVLRKISSIPGFKVSFETLKAWLLIEKVQEEHRSGVIEALKDLFNS